MAQAPGLNPWLQFTQDEASGYERLLSDVARTSFYEGREFRIYKELNIPASQTYVQKIVVPVNIIIYGASIAIDGGWIRAASVVGGTEGGVFTAMSRFAVNGMTGVNRRSDYSGAVYQPQVTFSEGGTHTGGTELDVVRAKTSNNNNNASSVGEVGQDERGIPPGTYYFRFLNLSGSDAGTGMFRFRWAELP